MVKRLSIGVVGLGRMGARHSLHLLQRVPRAELTAACSIDANELAWAREHLAPYGTTLYDSVDAFLAHPGLEAVLVATSTTVHASITLQAIAKGKHVLCEKPLSTNIEEARAVVASASAHPELKVMCGFSRRFDASYRDCAARIASGSIGRPTVLRSQTCDRYDPSGYFIGYSKASGGIFVDCSIHDIDLSLFFFGADAVPRSVSAVGVAGWHPELLELDDRDNAVGIVEFWGGRIAHFFASRTMPHGQNDSTEILGTKGLLRVNVNPTNNLVELCEGGDGVGGVRREIPQDYFGRFKEAFVTEAQEFTDSVLENKAVPLPLEGALKALEIGAALQESLVRRIRIEFDESGKRITPPAAVAN